MEGSSGGGGAATNRGRRRKADGVEPLEDEDDVVVVKPVDVIEGSKHRDGSIFRADAHPLHELFCLADTSETRLKPMRLSDPTPDCYPCWTACRQHLGCAMLQIFSLKLTNLPPASAAAGPVEIYGFIAVRDLLDPLRNYVFNHTRSHPFVMQDPMSDPFIYLSGPKRGVYLQSRALIEYDLRIKSPASGGEEADDDSPLIDGAATLSELTWTNAVLTNRIAGDLGAAAVDMRRALFRDAVEATVDVWITKLAAGDGGGGIDLSMTGCVSNLPEDEIKLFRGVVREPCALGRFVVAARLDSYLFLQFRVAEGVVSSDEFEWFAFRVTSHGCSSDRRRFGFATVEVKVTWSSLC